MKPCRPRSAVMALLSWLGLPLCGEAQDTPSSKAAPCAQEPVPTAAIEAALSRLDAAFAARDAGRYVALFAPDHAGTHALLRQRLEQVFAAAPPLQHSSHLVGTPFVLGPRTVARVRQELWIDPQTGAANTPTAAMELPDLVFAFRHGDAAETGKSAAGTAVPTFAIEVPRQIVLPQPGRFRCPPCNYEIGPAAGWLCVPVARDRAQALEASTFYLLGTDVACDVTVRIDDAPKPPTEVVAELAAVMQQWEPRAMPGLPEAWLPPAHREAPGALHGAVVELDVPPAAGAPDGSTIRFHVVQLGALEHHLFVRGGKPALRTHAAAVEELLASFHVLEPDIDRATAAARPLQAHVGGVLDGRAYHNEKYGVAMTGPDGWQARQRCGGAAFRVSWESAAGDRLWLTGYSVPVGMAHWCRDTADCWLAELCRNTGISLPAEAPGWRDDPTCNTLERTVRCSADPRQGLGVRLLHVRLRPDLLILVDGAPRTPDDEVAVQDAIRSLRL